MMLYDLIIGVVKRIERFYQGILLKKFVSQLKSAGSDIRISFPVYTYGLENVSIGDNFKAGVRLKLRTFRNWEGAL